MASDDDVSESGDISNMIASAIKGERLETSNVQVFGGSAGNASTNDSSGSRSWPSLKELGPGWLKNNWATFKTLVTGPETFIRGVLFGTIFRGIATVVTTIYSGFVLLVGGSQPDVLGGANEQVYGLVDLPVVAATGFASWLADGLRTYFDVLEHLITQAVPQTGNPIAGIIVTVVSVLVTVLLIEVMRRVIVALLVGVADLDPTGILTTIITFFGIGT